MKSDGAAEAAPSITAWAYALLRGARDIHRTQRIAGGEIPGAPGIATLRCGAEYQVQRRGVGGGDVRRAAGAERACIWIRGERRRHVVRDDRTTDVGRGASRRVRHRDNCRDRLGLVVHLRTLELDEHAYRVSGIALRARKRVIRLRDLRAPLAGHLTARAVRRNEARQVGEREGERGGIDRGRRDHSDAAGGGVNSTGAQLLEQHWVGRQIRLATYHRGGDRLLVNGGRAHLALMQGAEI